MTKHGNSAAIKAGAVLPTPGSDATMDLRRRRINRTVSVCNLRSEFKYSWKLLRKFFASLFDPYAMAFQADAALPSGNEFVQSFSEPAAPTNSGVLGFRSSDFGHMKILTHYL